MIRSHEALLFLTCLLLIACAESTRNTTLFEAPKSLGTNKDKDLEEVSGLAASVKNPGYLWAHNDSGNDAEIFLLDLECKTSRVFKLDSARNRDWEDITLGAGPVDSLNYLYIGDIGDNYNRHHYKHLYRIEEPSLDQKKHLTQVKKFLVRLSDGMKDAEALTFDPQTRNLYLFTKREPSIGLYEIKFPFEKDTLDAIRVATLPLTQIVAAGISRDGKEVLVRNYDQIFYWKRKGNETLPELLQTPAIELEYDREPQGESITWAIDGSGFYTLSENAHGQRGKLLFYRKK